VKVLFIEPHADGLLDIAMRAKAAGHTAWYYCHDYDPRNCPVGRGLVDRVADWRTVIRRCDLVLLGANDYCLHEMQRYRAQGIPIIGGSTESAEWESDRAKGMQVFKRAGIPVPPYRAFTSYDDAIGYVKRQDRPFVSKPSGKCDDKALSYVAKTPRDLIYMLDRWRRAVKRQGLEFILQEKVKGIEFAVGAWFGPGGFAEGWEENFEFKKLMPGNLGPNTGEMGTVMRYVKKSKMAEKVLRPVEAQLGRLGYIGNVDVNCIVDEDGTPWPLEFTMRCGWPAFNIEQDLFDVDPMEFLAGLAAGKPPYHAHKWDEIAVGVVVAIPDFPYSHITRKEVVGVPIWGLDQRSMARVHLAQAMMGEGPNEQGRREPCLATAGDYVMIVTGLGEAVQAARQSAYRLVKKVEIPNSPFWRVDIGARLSRELPELQRHGYAAGMVFSV